MLLPRRMLRDRVRLQALAGHGAYADVWADEVEVWGNVQTITSLTSDSGGDTDLLTAVVVLLPPRAQRTDGQGFVDATALTTQARVVLPDTGDPAAEASTRRVRSLQVHRLRGRVISVELRTT